MYWRNKKMIEHDPRKDFVSEKSVPITTTIPYRIWKEIKESKSSWNSLILRGWAAQKGFEEMTERLRETEHRNSNQERNIARLQAIIFDLQEKMQGLENAE